MWITDLLQAGKQTQDAQNSQNIQATGREQLPAALQKEIQALTPGQILSGRILERSGEDIKLLINFQGSEMELQARLEQNMALSMSKNILFQVKNNGTGLSLNPLFENMGTEANAQKAVQMASLPVNDTTMQLTGLLMKEGMPIDREALQNFYHEVTTFADAQLMDIIDLHKLGMPVNVENLEQINSYKNMTHQMMEGINELSGQLPRLLSDMSAKGMDQEVGRLLTELLLNEDGTSAVEVNAQTVLEEEPSTASLSQEEETASSVNRQEQMMPEGENPPQAPSAGKTIVITEEGIQLRDEGGDAIRSGENVKENVQQSDRAALKPQGGENPEENVIRQSTGNDLLRRVAQTLAQGRQLPLRELVKSPEFQRQLQEHIRQELSLRPQDTSKEKLDQVYGRLGRHLGALSEALTSAGQENGMLGKTVQNLNQNLNFLNQLNDAYSYVQLPLKMMDSDAHGELYVYANRQKKAVQEGEVSALLHLDMANLGPMDVYVQLREDKVSTRFYLPQEEMLDFIAEHIDLLNQRLEKRGYHMNCAFQVREMQNGNTVMRELIEEQSNRPACSDYSFDAFA
ncbi:MAG: flagellar hook-length control protein FliK [bacterium]|nr:flagellar hook-length control protein FliK [bacterium]MCM1376275.1 flagellar hook-length control protein FliK [Muribaculum sp.]